MLANLPYARLAALVAGLIVLLAIFGYGHHLGAAQVQRKLDAVILADTQAANAQLAQLAKDRMIYDSKIRQINQAARDGQAELERLRATPRSRVVCHTAPEAGSGAVSEAGRAGARVAPGTGKLPPEPGFDPTDALYAEADRADSIVEACRAGLARRDAAIGGSP